MEKKAIIVNDRCKSPGKRIQYVGPTLHKCWSYIFGSFLETLKWTFLVKIVYGF